MVYLIHKRTRKKFKIGDRVIFGYNFGIITGYDTLFNRYKIGSRFAYEYEIVLATKENMNIANKKYKKKELKIMYIWT